MPASVPPMFAKTLPSATSGEPAAPKKFFGPLYRRIVSSLHSRVPLARDRMELAFRAEGVDDAVGHHGHRSRPSSNPKSSL